MKKSFGLKTRRVLAAVVSLAILLGTLVTVAVPTALGNTAPTDQSGYEDKGLTPDSVFDFDSAEVDSEYASANATFRTSVYENSNGFGATYVGAPFTNFASPVDGKGNSYLKPAVITKEIDSNNSAAFTPKAPQDTFHVGFVPGFDSVTMDVCFTFIPKASNSNSAGIIPYSATWVDTSTGTPYYSTQKLSIRDYTTYPAEGDPTEFKYRLLINNTSAPFANDGYFPTDYNPVGKWLTFKFEYPEIYCTSTNTTRPNSRIMNVYVYDRDTKELLTQSYYGNDTTGNSAAILTYGPEKDSVTTGPETIYVGAFGNNNNNINQIIKFDNIRASYQSSNIAAVEEKINAIGTVENTTKCKEKIDIARASYDVLVQADRDLITNYETLTAAEAAYADMVAAGSALPVVQAIAAIGTVVDTPECEAKIAEVEALYAALSDDDKAKVGNYDVLLAARATLTGLKVGVNQDTVYNFDNSVAGDYDGFLPFDHEAYTINRNKDTETTPFAWTEKGSATVVVEEGGNKCLSIATNPNTTINKTLALFPALPSGDIDTLSFKMKVPSWTATDAKQSVGIVAYSEAYNGDGELSGNTYYTMTSLGFQQTRNATANTTTHRFFVGDRNAAIPGAPQLTDTIDPIDNWMTVTLKYGTTVFNSTNGVKQQKYIESMTLTATKLDGTQYSETKTLSSTNENDTLRYGVAGGYVTDTSVDKGPVYIGFVSTYNMAQAAYFDDIRVTYRQDKAIKNMKALTEKFGDTITSDDITAKDIENIGYAKTACERMTANNQSAKITDYAATVDALYTFSQIKKPTITGGTILVETNAQNQQLRFNVMAPTVPTGATVTEFGAVMLPTQLLNGTLTLSTADIANPKTVSSELPEKWGSVLLKIPNASSGTDYCGVKVTARAYVKVTVGNYTYISYSDTAERSVNSIAKTMFNRLTDTTNYPTATYGDITYTTGVADSSYGFGDGQTKPADLETVLEFLKANETRIAAIAAAQ